MAALGVMCSHYIAVFWYRPDVIATFLKIPAFTTEGTFFRKVSEIWVTFSPLDTGPLGVSVFFLISGFVLPFSIEKLDRKRFFLNRLLRIYPTYIAGFAVSSAAVFFIDRYFGMPIGYSQKDLIAHAVPGLREIFNTPNIDGVVWTLEIELKFYSIWLVFGRRVATAPLVIATVAVLLALQLSLSRTFQSSYWLGLVSYSIPYLIYFFIGTWAHIHYKKRLSTLALLSGILIIFGATITARLLGPEAQSARVLINYAIGLLIFFSFYRYPQPLNKMARWLEPLAQVSYPLYAVHSVLGYVILRLLLDAGLPIVGVPLAFGIAIAFAFVLHSCVEKTSLKLAHRLTRPSSKR